MEDSQKDNLFINNNTIIKIITTKITNIHWAYGSVLSTHTIKLIQSLQTM